jgi:O-antigen/teichoic acid export membrane protein
MGLLPASLLEAMFPEMSRLAGVDKGEARLRSVFRRGGWAMLGAGVLLAALGTWAAPLLVSVVYSTGEDYDPAILVFRILVWAIPAMFLYLLSGHMLYALNRQRRVTVAMLVVGVLNIGLNLIVIPRWSYIGCAVVALLSEWLLWALLYPQARRALAARPHSDGHQRGSYTA